MSDLRRRPAEVLAACERRAVVRVRHRDGRIFEIRPHVPATPWNPAPVDPAKYDASMAAFKACKKALFEKYPTLPPRRTRKSRPSLEKLIAGE